MQKRFEREKETIRHMLEIYCRGRHRRGSLCPACGEILRYSQERIDACSYTGAAKPVCGLCPSNCFTPAMHRQMSLIMRYSGPRMMYRFPVLTVLHLLDALRWKTKKGR